MDHQVYFNGTEFIPLHHPGEAFALRRLGVDEAEALLQGQIYWRNYCVCLNCRSLTTKRTLRLPDWYRAYSASADRLAIGGVVVVAVVALVLGWPMFVAALAALPLLMGLQVAFSALARRAARRSAERLESELRSEGMAHENARCGRCGGTRGIDYLQFVLEHRSNADQRRESMRCPKCNQLQLHHDDAHHAWA